jgi:hypothetical protein
MKVDKTSKSERKRSRDHDQSVLLFETWVIPDRKL